MSNLKDYTKVIIIALLTTLVGQIIARTFDGSDKLNNSASKKELLIIEEKAYEYTDNQINVHEEKEGIKYNYLVKTIDEMNKMVKDIHEQTIRHDEKLKDPAFKTRGEKKETKYLGF